MSVFEHFRKEEYAFVEQALEWKDTVETKFERKLTDFLDPREQDILSSVVGKDETVYLSFWGGSTECERKRALLYPFYEEVSNEDFDLSLFQVTYPVKFVTLEHPDVLGSLTGLGLKRGKYGDILKGNGLFQFVVAEEVALYIEMNLQQIGKATVQTERISVENMLPVQEDWEEIHTTTPSFRLDKMIAEMYRLSRSKALPYIEKGRVKVNWRTIDRPAFTLQPGDYVSVRGQGRRKLMETMGQTKKERFKIKYGKKKDS
ncbi:RNA-binding protein YlmH [Salibacterium salarium]|uniref:YlmH family RNA-binding protein n=1 Tax=Salibacterium salarium TaxID=284579 RepID=UPI0027854CDC|nr:RNA-binding protein [Salibacterium salarium]MDQ0299058.1 RNA-binding protein YlmH [Salibacterium salarium]